MLAGAWRKTGRGSAPRSERGPCSKRFHSRSCVGEPGRDGPRDGACARYARASCSASDVSRSRAGMAGGQADTSREVLKRPALQPAARARAIGAATVACGPPGARGRRVSDATSRARRVTHARFAMAGCVLVHSQQANRAEPYTCGSPNRFKAMSVVLLGPKAASEDARTRAATAYPYGSGAATALMIAHGPQDGRQSLRGDPAAELEDHIEARRRLSPDANRKLVNDALLTAAQQGSADIVTRLLATYRSTREGRANALAVAAQGARAPLPSSSVLLQLCTTTMTLRCDWLLETAACWSLSSSWLLARASTPKMATRCTLQPTRGTATSSAPCGWCKRAPRSGQGVFGSRAARPHRNHGPPARAAGADVHRRDDEALRAACALGKDRVVAYLLARGADAHALEDQATRVAAKMGKESTVRFLLEAGAAARAGDDEALWWAVEGGHEAVAQLLRAHAAGALETRVHPSAAAIRRYGGDPFC